MFCFPLCIRKPRPGLLNRLLIGMVHPVQAREALQVGRRPSILPRQQRRDFSLRSCSIRHGALVHGSLAPHQFLCGLHARLERHDADLEGLDTGVARQVIDPLRGYEDVALQLVHDAGEALAHGAAPVLFRGGELLDDIFGEGRQRRGRCCLCGPSGGRRFGVVGIPPDLGAESTV